MNNLLHNPETVNPSADSTTPQSTIANLCEGATTNGAGPERITTAIWPLLASGLSIIPIDHKTKRPLMAALPIGDDNKSTWKPYQERQPLSTEVDQWLAMGIKSMAVVFGAVSGNAELLDFDHNPEATPRPYSADEFFGPWWAACGDLVEKYDIPVWRTGGGGYAIAYRCEMIAPNNKLAWVPDESAEAGRSIAIETRGEGGYALVPPSLHPEGGRYTMVRGDLARIPTIPTDVRAKFLEVARSLCLAPYAKQDLTAAIRKHTKQRAADGLDSVIATFNANNSIVALLEKYGYTHAHGDRWVRPNGKSGSVDVFTGENVSFHWSSNDVLHRTNGAGPVPVDPFQVYTIFEHSGDHGAAFVAAKKALGLWVEPQAAPEMPSWMADAPPPAPDTIIDPETGEIIPLSKQPPAVAITDEPEESDISSPLDITPVSGLDLGWVDRYAAVISEMTGSPVEFNRLAGLVTIATAIQRKAVLRMAFGDIYPNIYGCIVAPSSVFHKSSAIQKPRLLMNRADLGRLFLSELMTSEGLLKELRGQSSGVILRDEIGTLFDSHNTKYLRQLKPDLTAIFDCYPYSRRLSNEEIKVEKPYLNILGATTPTRFFEGISLTDWTDGFLARWLFVTPESEPNFDAMTSLYTKKHDEKVTQLSWKLQEINRRDGADFVLQDDAHQLWDAWQRQAAKDAYYFGDDIAAAIVTRYSTYALKFAIILSACNGAWGTITADEMQTAIHLADSYKGYAHKLLQEKGNFGISGAKLQKVFMMVKRPPKSKDGKQLTATRKTLMQYANMKKGELDPCIEKLLEIGAIIENGKRFAPAVDELPVKSWK